MRIRDHVPSSFRDPSGFVFDENGLIYRQVNLSYKENYEFFVNSGIYEALLKDELIIPHREVGTEIARPAEAYKVIQPEEIPFLSYPYEWSYSQLKDAALTTLKIQKKALEFGMSLKDSSAYNIQFRKGKPIFIDTLSFEKYREGQPWVAYRQFCQHFLAPLALMSCRDIRLSQLLRIYIDGIPLDLASRLLPFNTRFNFALLSHIHFHAKSQKHFADKPLHISGYKMSRLSFLALLDNLISAVEKSQWRVPDTEWGDYYEDTNYSPDAFQHKQELVAEFLGKINPRNVWDIGANIGLFSRIASNRGILTISFDNDPVAVENNYLECVKRREVNILPLLIDLANPSPGAGWENQERMSFLERGPADAVFALALIHHLAISNNLPLGRISEFFSRICKSLIIEFVPKSDSQVQRLLSTREDIFPGYTQQAFELEFDKYFTNQHCVKVKDSERVLYLMTKR
jgi:hypothetical protein